jgi:mono/diheme cytochrome c family protein
MRKILAGGSAAALVMAMSVATFAGTATIKGLTDERPPQAEKASKGEQVFTAQKCALCHSVGGHGNPKGPLDGVATKVSADDLREWITDAKEMTVKTKATRKPAMKQLTLSKDDVDALVAYLQTLKRKSMAKAADAATAPVVPR